MLLTLGSQYKLMSCNQVVPVILNMSHFSKMVKQEWYSSPLFAFDDEYQMYLRVDAGGNGKGKGTYILLFLYL